MLFLSFIIYIHANDDFSESFCIHVRPFEKKPSFTDKSLGAYTYIFIPFSHSVNRFACYTKAEQKVSERIKPLLQSYIKTNFFRINEKNLNTTSSASILFQQKGCSNKAELRMARKKRKQFNQLIEITAWCCKLRSQACETTEISMSTWNLRFFHCRLF